MEKKAITRANIFGARDQKTVEVQVPEWGDGAFVIVRSLSAEERDNYELTNAIERSNGGKPKNIRAKLVVLGVVDEAGKQVFTNGDIDELSKRNSAPVSRIADEIRRLSGMMEEDTKTAIKN